MADFENVLTKNTMKAKPFIKWVGGKTQLIDQLEALLPADFDKWEKVTYIEPFVGGGAMLFYKNALIYIKNSFFVKNILLFKKKALTLQRI